MDEISRGYEKGMKDSVSIRSLSRITGCARSTIQNGINELREMLKNGTN